MVCPFQGQQLWNSRQRQVLLSFAQFERELC